MPYINNKASLFSFDQTGSYNFCVSYYLTLSLIGNNTRMMARPTTKPLLQRHSNPSEITKNIVF